MQRAVLIYNPASGGRREQRLADVHAAYEVIRGAGVQAEMLPTRGPGSATEQAREAAASFDTVIACGGDGTVNEALQGIAGTGAALGIIPLGTGNVLAKVVGLSTGPATAAAQLLKYQPKLVTAGRMQYHHKHEPGTKLFAAAGGVGPDAQLMYEMSSASKGRFGMAAYYAKAGELYVAGQWFPFAVEYVDAESGKRVKDTVTQVLAARVSSFGGLLKDLVPGASLDRHDLRVLLTKTTRWRISMYLLARILRSKWIVPGVKLAHASEVTCTPLPGPDPEKQRHHHPLPKIYAEMDGEVVGGLPVKFDAVRDAFRLLVPAEKSRNGKG